MSADAPLLEITSHIDGKNAKVRVYPDRVEWDKAGKVSGAKVTAGILTAGASFAATGARSRRGAGSDMLLMDAIQGVTTRRDTVLNDVVVLHSSSGVIEMRCSKKEAASMKELILAVKRGAYSQPVSTQPASPPPPVQPSWPANWYPDPHNDGLLRYWDGARWTEHTHPKG